MVLVLCSLSGCKKNEFPQIEDTQVNALDWGNIYAAEQGDWIAMNSHGEGGKGILLYNKTEQNSLLIAQGDYKNIGLLDNKVFYCTGDDQSNLYCFDLAKGEARMLAEKVQYYQVRNGMVYFYTEKEAVLHTIHLESGAQSTIKLSYTPKRFWWTDYGLYYYCADNGRLMVLPDGKSERFVLHSETEILDLAAIKGAQIVYLEQGQKMNVLYSFNPAGRQIKERYQTSAEQLIYTRERVVLAEGTTICSLDLATGEQASWGSIEASEVQLLSDCAIAYRGGLPEIHYYK